MPANEILARRIAMQMKHHRFYLWLAVVVVMLAFLLTVRSDQRVALRPLPRIVLPESCQSRIWFGMDCPGCGLTRSFVYLAAGNLTASYASHRVGWLLAIAVLGQIPYRWFALRRLRLLAAPLNVSLGEDSELEVMDPDGSEAEGDDVRSSEESSVLVRTPVWVEAFAKLLLVSLIGNWVLKVLGY